MAEWVKVGMALGIGGAGGFGDQIIQNRDDKEEDRRHKIATGQPGALAVNKKLPALSQFGTYYDYGVPLAAVGLTAAGVLKGDNALMALTLGGALAGRKITHQATVKARPVIAGWTVWERQGNTNPPPPGPSSPPMQHSGVGLDF